MAILTNRVLYRIQRGAFDRVILRESVQSDNYEQQSGRSNIRAGIARVNIKRERISKVEREEWIGWR